MGVLWMSDLNRRANKCSCEDDETAGNTAVTLRETFGLPLVTWTYFSLLIQEYLSISTLNVKQSVRTFFLFFACFLILASHAGVRLCWTLRTVRETNQSSQRNAARRKDENGCLWLENNPSVTSPHSTLAFTHRIRLRVDYNSDPFIWVGRVRQNTAGK